MRVAFPNFLAAAVIAALAACGGSSSTPTGSTSSPSSTPNPSTPGTTATQLVITIQNMTFTPAQLTVPAGATVTVRNLDSIEHSVTSESTPNAFTPGAASGVQFDTGLFTGQRTFTIPANAPAGAIIHFYCRAHTSAMTPPNPTITISGASTGTSTPSSGTATSGGTSSGTPPSSGTPASGY